MMSCPFWWHGYNMSKSVPGEGWDFLGGPPGRDERRSKRSHSLQQNRDPQPPGAPRGRGRRSAAGGGESGRGPRGRG